MNAGNEALLSHAIVLHKKVAECLQVGFGGFGSHLWRLIQELFGD